MIALVFWIGCRMIFATMFTVLYSHLFSCQTTFQAAPGISREFENNTLPHSEYYDPRINDGMAQYVCVHDSIIAGSICTLQSNPS